MLTPAALIAERYSLTLGTLALVSLIYEKRIRVEIPEGLGVEKNSQPSERRNIGNTGSLGSQCSLASRNHRGNGNVGHLRGVVRVGPLLLTSERVSGGSRRSGDRASRGGGRWAGSRHWWR